MMNMTPQQKKTFWLWFGIVLVVALLLRLSLLLFYPAVHYSDTPGYWRAAEAAMGGFKVYDGTRTPGYPVFLGLMGSNALVYGVQLLMGLVLTMLFFFFGWRATSKPVFGAIAAMLHTLNPGQFFFEANLLSETISTFWVMLALMGGMMWLMTPRWRTWWVALAIGLVTAFAVLTRPLFIFLPPLMVILLAVTIEQKKLSLNWRAIIGISAPILLIVGGWVLWIYQNYHMLGISTMNGFHMIQHTGYYFEDVPDEYAALRDTYLEYRDARIAQYGTQGNAIWDAIPAMQAASGLSFYDLSRTLQKISVELIRTHPLQFAGKVLKGWWFFWRAPVYWASEQATGWGNTAVTAWVWLWRGGLFLCNMLFILSSAAALFSKKLRLFWQVKPFLALLALAVWLCSFFQSILDHGDNPRFLIPLQSAVVFWVLWVAFYSMQGFQQKKLMGKQTNHG